MKLVKELMHLRGRVALITGGGGHVGAAAAEALAELGASVAVLDIDRSSCLRVTRSIKTQYGVPTMPLVVNLSNETATRSVPAQVLRQFGRLDIVVNCAALVATSRLKGWTSLFETQRTAAWRKALEVNLTAPFVLVQACAKSLAASHHGSVVNIGSIYGVVGPDLRIYHGTRMGNSAAYATSKGGVIQLTRWLATVLAPAIRVNAITCGGVYRNQPRAFVRHYAARTPLKRMATEEDLKGAVAYLASDLSRYVTGHNLVVDGGWTAW